MVMSHEGCRGGGITKGNKGGTWIESTNRGLHAPVVISICPKHLSHLKSALTNTRSTAVAEKALAVASWEDWTWMTEPG